MKIIGKYHIDMLDVARQIDERYALSALRDDLEGLIDAENMICDWCGGPQGCSHFSASCVKQFIEAHNIKVD